MSIELKEYKKIVLKEDKIEVSYNEEEGAVYIFAATDESYANTLRGHIDKHSRLKTLIRLLQEIDKRV